MTAKSCLKSMRLRTLPLSLAGVIVGIALASTVGALDVPVVIALLFTTAFLQILSNLSNELGDTLHGTDTDGRQGIRYSIQDGEMTVPQMKGLICVVAALCCASGLVMVWCSFGTVFAVEPLCLLALGAAAIWAAMRYTLGRNPYGYRGLGDVFVFIFFGLVSVLGAGYVCSHVICLLWVLPSAAIGCWSIGVLNVNNIRDMKTDAATRTTVALKLGVTRARVYQTVLVIAGWLCMLSFNLLSSGMFSGCGGAWGCGLGGCAAGIYGVGAGWFRWAYFATIPLFYLHLKGVWTRLDRALDPMLPLLVLTTFLTSILFGVALI